MYKKYLSVLALALIAAACVSPEPFQSRFQTALDGAHRQSGHAERDRFRHPTATLTFMGIEPRMNVVEISPGGGWYTDILASYLDGALYAAHANPSDARPYVVRQLQSFSAQSAAHPAIYAGVTLAIFDPNNKRLDVPKESVDAVLTFRNVHNWVGSNSHTAAFELFYDILVPGGILGVVEHRGAAGMSPEAMHESGYMSQEQVIEIAGSAGFVLAASSEINANPLDTANHPRGVWSLPPTLALGATDRQRYLEIGESDRMTLRFFKPER
ncbi:MAG: methyltransferase [Porticoccaceae bacterium]|nr:methyltransferase [Porticoccaceae bacterium]